MGEGGGERAGEGEVEEGEEGEGEEEEEGEEEGEGQQTRHEYEDMDEVDGALDGERRVNAIELKKNEAYRLQEILAASGHA